MNWSQPCAYDGAQKSSFHATGRSRLRRLAAALELRAGTYAIRSNMGGIAVSGEVTLRTPTLYVQLCQPATGHDTGLMARSCSSGRDPSLGDRTQFLPLAALDDIAALATAVRRFHGEAVQLRVVPPPGARGACVPTAPPSWALEAAVAKADANPHTEGPAAGDAPDSPTTKPEASPVSNPILRRITIESVVLLPEEDAGELAGKTCFEILAEGEGAYSRHDWLVTSRIAASEGVSASGVAAALQETDEPPDHYDDLVEREAERLGFAPIQVGDTEVVWMREDGADDGPHYSSALDALISVERPQSIEA